MAFSFLRYLFFSFVLEIFMFLYYCIATIAISDERFSSSSHVSEKRYDGGKFMNKTLFWECKTESGRFLIS